MDPKTKFYHLRYFDQYGISPRGGITYAFMEVEPNVIVYATAKCNFVDNYNKKYGRTKAAGRLQSEFYCNLFEGTKKEFIEAINSFVLC